MNPPHPSDPAAGPTPPAGEPQPLIREWHHMTPAEQSTEWTDLVAWVIWIHDLYELAKEERLPLCWHRHPGLVEELRALKAWRTAIYNSPDAAASAHTARSWHGELRQTIHAIATFWAPACRAGHTDAPHLATIHPNLPTRWRQAGPPLMASSPTPESGTNTNQMSHHDMSTALRAGHAEPHSAAAPHYAKLAGTWWTRDPDGTTWTRCVDPHHHAHLDDTSARLRAADTAVNQLNP